MENPLTKSPAQNSTRLDPDEAEFSVSRLKPLPVAFYLRDTLKVARDLLGKGLCVRRPEGTTLIEIVEVEAYLGSDDPASHSFRGVTARNAAMFRRGGTCYVYLSYGINYCMNVSTREEGIGEAVLLRAGRPLSGIEIMRRRRAQRRDVDLTNGPGKLTEALGVDLSYNGMSFNRPDFKICDLSMTPRSADIQVSRRIGISKAVENEWRFTLRNSPYLSRRGA